MASQRWISLVLLASLIFLFCWTTVSALSLGDPPNVPSSQYRDKRDMAASTREQVQASTEAVKASLTTIIEVMQNLDVKKVKDIMASFSKIASLAPGIGTLAASVLNMVLAFIPQEDLVLKEVKKGFAEVNRKLDLLSIQISNLATDVEWFNYASIYSRDEVAILNAWDKLNDLRQNSNLVSTDEERLRLAEIFANYYESSGAESSVSNLYRYLTVDSTSLSENLNNLLKKKFKCDVKEIGRYNLYFSGLLWKGMFVNQFYWKLMGFNTVNKEAEHVEMFTKVYEAQYAAIDFCLQNYTDYMKKDVEETAKGLSADDKMAVALKVKAFLDKKYNWYNWVVVVYNKADKNNHIVFDAAEIEAGEIIVLVSHTPHASLSDETYIRETAETCFSNKYCTDIKINQCVEHHGGTYPAFTEYAKVTHVTYYEDFAEVPTPLHRVGCSWSTGGGRISIHFSRTLPTCTDYLCHINRRCGRLLYSNEWVCRCPAGFYGEYCEQRIDKSVIPRPDAIFPPIKTVQDRLKILENGLKELRCHNS
ncbi:cephalotoxin-like protein [Xiphophorus couchianus]|uniref:EGF-like domain-containing protein n=1 Tax=Xiphophorus couchianus TaxID=32473 RepID=A0A3B5MWX2_9TELE|nr:cephalotoxin-like protein [Xiphophorus couchianus]XP_027897198.1 cephalotoxin-like protein [Xiphophorus couchianus]